jgi:hypothetical protein
MESTDLGTVQSSTLLTLRFTKSCRKDINPSCTFPHARSLTFDRREAANQTQWFDGIIRTVRLEIICKANYS